MHPEMSLNPESLRYRTLTIEPTRRIPTLAEDLREGLQRRPRSLPPKYFYDGAGSALFEQICQTAEYYPTRAESALLAEHAERIVSEARPQYIVEFGSGNSRKTRYLLDACDRLAHPVEYWPYDVCREILEQAGEEMVARYSWLQVQALLGDYTAGLGPLPRPDGRALFVFLGGTLGNFTPAEAQAFLSELRGLMRPGDTFLLGADRVKAPAVLEAAYNDAAGVTAQFNLNVLQVINRELEADFDVDGFEHRAIYNREAAQVEMHLVARRSQEVTIQALGEPQRFEEGEYILTEISRKFTAERLEATLRQAGLTPSLHFEGGEQLFSLMLAR